MGHQLAGVLQRGLPGDAHGGVGLALQMDDAALDDGTVIEAIGGGHLHQGRDLSAAAGLAIDGHVVRVAAEGGDVLVNPAQSRGQVGDARVAGGLIGRVVLRQVQEAQDVQPVVDRHGDHVAVAGLIGAVVGQHLHGAAAGVAAAVEPDHDGLTGLGV